MARWRLLNEHYINVPGTEWEYKEQSKETGKQARKVFPVPLFLNPRDQADHNYPGEIIVSNKPYNRDIVFVGPPTPDMEPLDEEAQAISKAESHKWIHPIESLPGQGFSKSLLDDLMQQVAAAAAGQVAKPAAAVSQSQVNPQAFEQLQAQVAQLMARNLELEAKAELVARRA